MSTAGGKMLRAQAHVLLTLSTVTANVGQSSRKTSWSVHHPSVPRTDSCVSTPPDGIGQYSIKKAAALPPLAE
eukprot:CAMPEP_0206320712 /NCGR_PEP_ID=MMETSP0106_2-20121207/18477_1 /ASSEMBLY_ACC=CAM_ASM_000206 /TAXON_ID=81532 /ORGANISM="Acanthoeca-like sp., Strain 10tr" /LENGTH=72 /DNA_ID=CAMNT_0053752713 /DNA_START=102 /DNA_END=320 /DNA_ORIENTATION=-